MRDVSEVLSAEGSMGPAEILPLLKPATVRGAAEHRKPLKTRTAGKNMAGRAKQVWYFAAGEAETFSRGIFSTLGHRRTAKSMGAERTRNRSRTACVTDTVLTSDMHSPRRGCCETALRLLGEGMPTKEIVRLACLIKSDSSPSWVDRGA